MRLCIAAFLATLVLLAPPTAAQMESREGIALQNQILELRREVQALRDAVGRGGAAAGGSSLGGAVSRPIDPRGAAGSSDLTAALVDRVQQLEEEVRRLRGRVDETGFAQQRGTEEMRKAMGDLEFRIQELEGRGGQPRRQGAAPAEGGGAAAAARPAQPAPRTPENALREGNAALARRDYAAAEAAAREVLAARNSPRALDAQFLLAEAMFGRQEYQQAALAYDDVYRRARTGSRAPDALLGLANSFVAINERRSACDTLNQLRSEFPTPRADLRDRIAQARQRAGCR